MVAELRRKSKCL